MKHWTNPIVLCLLALVGVTSTSEAIAKPDAAMVDDTVIRVGLFLDDGRLLGTGSGFFVTADGYVVTNHHVIDVPDGVNEKLTLMLVENHTERRIPVETVWFSEEFDLALLKMDRKSGAFVTLFDGIVAKGSEVWAAGFPGVTDRMNRKLAIDPSLTSGVVGRVQTDGSWRKGPKQFEIVQHNAEVNKGNSGGPLFDACGRVVGVNTAVAIMETFTAKGRSTTATFAPGNNHASASRVAIKNALKTNRVDATLDSSPCESVEDRLAQRQNYLIALIVALAVLVGVALFFALRRPQVKKLVGTVTGLVRKPRENRRQGNAQRLELSGQGSKGQPLVVSVPAEFVRDRGVSFGRLRDVVDCDIRDAEISKRHFRVTRANGRTYLADLNSANGTCLNGRRLAPFAPNPVQHGDRITIGRVSLALKIGNEAAPIAA